MSILDKITDFLERGVGDGLDNDPEDVERVQRHMNDLGHFDERPNGVLSRLLDKGVRAFQSLNNLKVDGKMHPGGETERTIYRERTGKDPNDIWGPEDDGREIGFGQVHTHFETKPKSNAAHATPKDEEKDGGSLLGGIGSALASGTDAVKDAVLFPGQAKAGAADFAHSFGDMWDATHITGYDPKTKEHGWQNQDWYFHCRANCRAAQRGKGGLASALAISDARERWNNAFDNQQPFEEKDDRQANAYGLTQGINNPDSDCRQLCDEYRPGGNFPDRY